MRTPTEAAAVYDQLPEVIKRIYSYDEWVWLSDARKDALQAQETEPEWDE